jgi:catechol 2,3-dioxygenase-like lactoylglutathione lyase family enzyme
MSRAVEPLYVRYQLTDLDRQADFLTDFGLAVTARESSRLYMRGAGPAPFLYVAESGQTDRFLGAGLLVSSAQDLETLARLPGSGPVEPVDAPGGGWRVRMRLDDGFEIDAVHGVMPAAPLALAEPAAFNSGNAKPRRNQSIRTRRGITPAIRLGHFVLQVRDRAGVVAWMGERFGLVPSDHLAVPGAPEQVIGTFLRVDKGTDLTDHHCLLVLQADTPGIHHCSFEVQDLDAVMAAHDYLLQRGYRLDCGVGRHLLGSQIFDYWRDPFGFRVEHYTDGDVVNDAHRPTVFAGTADQTTQWGAEPPPEFFQ